MTNKSGTEEEIKKLFDHAAVKVPKPEGVDELKAEVEALSKLAHENVVAILGMTEGPSPGSDESNWMMCLEYCESDLFKLLYAEEHASEYSMDLMGHLCRQIVDGMAYVHLQSAEDKTGSVIPMLHLDLKPENVLIAKNEDQHWVAKVADFGWRPDIEQEEWTGTTQYMAPEFGKSLASNDNTTGVAEDSDA
eukprot:COSAG05_NODE_7536_length_799_cov_6710.162857_1_plen_191_part_10